MRMEATARGMTVTLLLDPASGLDVAAMVVDGIDLSPGDAIPSDGDPRIDQALKGFLFTCGPDHIRHPEPVGNGALYPLHGSLSGTLVPREAMTATETGCIGMVDIALGDGGLARLTRRWSIEEGSTAVGLDDRIENIGRTPFAPMWMYHLNLAGRLFDAGTLIAGDRFPSLPQAWRFGDGESAHVCLPAQGDEGWAGVCVGPFEALGRRSLEVRFRTDTLPFLQMWRCQRGGADVVSIEPVSHRIAKRPVLAASDELPQLAPGAFVDFALIFRMVDASAL